MIQVGYKTTSIKDLDPQLTKTKLVEVSDETNIDFDIEQLTGKQSRLDMHMYYKWDIKFDENENMYTLTEKYYIEKKWLYYFIFSHVAYATTCIIMFFQSEPFLFSFDFVDSMPLIAFVFSFVSIGVVYLFPFEVVTPLIPKMGNATEITSEDTTLGILFVISHAGLAGSLIGLTTNVTLLFLTSVVLTYALSIALFFEHPWLIKSQ